MKTHLHVLKRCCKMYFMFDYENRMTDKEFCKSILVDKNQIFAENGFSKSNFEILGESFTASQFLSWFAGLIGFLKSEVLLKPTGKYYDIKIWVPRYLIPYIEIIGGKWEAREAQDNRIFMFFEKIGKLLKIHCFLNQNGFRGKKQFNDFISDGEKRPGLLEAYEIWIKKKFQEEGFIFDQEKFNNGKRGFTPSYKTIPFSIEDFDISVFRKKIKRHGEKDDLASDVRRLHGNILESVRDQEKSLLFLKGCNFGRFPHNHLVIEIDDDVFFQRGFNRSFNNGKRVMPLAHASYLAAQQQDFLPAYSRLPNHENNLYYFDSIMRGNVLRHNRIRKRCELIEGELLRKTQEDRERMEREHLQKVNQIKNDYDSLRVCLDHTFFYTLLINEGFPTTIINDPANLCYILRYFDNGVFNNSGSDMGEKYQSVIDNRMFSPEGEIRYRSNLINMVFKLEKSAEDGEGNMAFVSHCKQKLIEQGVVFQ